ncbi:hypothetical protein XA68_11211 [Ophiocordyceps unilateralis]|uniref:1-phosphatidylinositol-4-phosphate 5-kinase n=1 Tax=Ophiocordyceps unilateralis TaxID=268505 RepID=A0A2A9PQ07_OPHUN|nr:hypothetical protein XA68_11211 [Ophiocordyceps unilateralis]
MPLTADAQHRRCHPSTGSHPPPPPFRKKNILLYDASTATSTRARCSDWSLIDPPATPSWCEMPLFVADNPSPVIPADVDVLNLDFTDETKANVAAVRSRSGISNDSFDESSASSSDTSDVARMHPNGNGTRPTSMSSLANSKSLAADADAHNTGKPLPPNGVTVLPDRTVPRSPLANGHSSAPAGQPGLIPESPTRPAPEPPMEAGVDDFKGDSDDAETSTPTEAHHGSTEPPNPEPTQSRGQLQRFSSPPAIQQFQPPATATSASGHLQPPNGQLTLKQRHTLEVPKPSSSRQSRDGADVVFATGRFSPSATGGPANRRASLNLVRRTTRSVPSDFPRDEVAPDEDAIRWAEAYRQKRASKRKRKEEEDDDRVLVGTKVDESHANWVTAYNMLTGIRVSVSRTNAKLDRDLTDADFEAKQKSTFDITGNELVPSAKYDFKFKDYAPWVFRRLRALFRLDPADYLVSLTGKYILSELGSPGKSGSFFYFSRDYKYIIKTIHHSEHKFLRKILKEYYNHVQQNPNTLLSQFYGLHRVKMPYGKKIHFVVMNNLFPPHRDIHQTFDLKGSTIGRDYKEADLARNPRATLKDLNWLRRKQHLELGIQKKQMFLAQLQRDVVLLKRLQIMDYSLLIGIHDVARGNEENLRDKTLQVFSPGGEKTTDDDPKSVLLRTPSKLENVRKARELRQMIRQERPVPMGQASARMPDELDEGQSRSGFVFHQDDGGYRATHEDNAPADEIYYLGVIDCLTHYGMIKKIEHFWKGLSSDRRQISALPPDEYGDRFFNFIEGVTMSAEEASERALRRDQEAAEAEAQEMGSHHGIPPMPDHQPPAPPVSSPTRQGRETLDMASKELRRTAAKGVSEQDVPERTLRAAAPAAGDQRDSLQHEPILPVVEEAGELSRAGRSPVSPPPTGPPPTCHAQLKTESSDSGYGGAGNGNGKGNVSRDGSLKMRPRLSRESLNKRLPPLPGEGEKKQKAGGVKVVA